jgi:hypothetical protein
VGVGGVNGCAQCAASSHHLISQQPRRIRRPSWNRGPSHSSRQTSATIQDVQESNAKGNRNEGFNSDARRGNRRVAEAITRPCRISIYRYQTVLGPQNLIKKRSLRWMPHHYRVTQHDESLTVCSPHAHYSGGGGMWP